MGTALGGRPSNQQIKDTLYLKEQLGLETTYLNKLEEICKAVEFTPQDERSICLTVGKAMLAFTNILTALNDLGIDVSE